MNLILFGPGARIPWRAHRVTLSQLSGIPLAVTLLLFISASTHAQYCVQWVQRTDVGTPGPRLGSAMAYDSDRGVTVLFGGEYHQSGNNDLFWDDTWEYDGIQWKPITIAGSKPQARDNHKMCYDTVRKQILLVGGRNENGLTRDAWVYYSTVPGVGTWVPMPYNGGGANFGFAFDESRGIAIVAGGIDQDVVSSDDTILWDGQQWTNVGTIGYSGINVHGLDDMAMAYDSSRQVVQYQGGRLRAPSSPPISPDDRGYYDTYEYSTGWHQSPLCYTADFNIMRYKHAMVYDRTRGRMVLFGGIPYGTSDADNIHGEYHPSFGWRSMNNFVATPPRRDRHVMVYDIRRGVTVLYGGVGNDNYNDTWELRPVTAAITLLDEPRQEHCEFENITLRTSVTTPSGSTLQWLHDGKPVPGANGVYLLLNSINSSHAGVYSLQVSDPCGNSVIGPPITLIVHTRPVITAFDNTRRARCPGDSVTFTVQSISTLPMTFQWWKVSPGNPIKIAGATQESLVLNNLTNTDTGEYYVEVANSCGSRYSSAGHLQVGPSILTQPQNASANACGEVSFSVLADGVGMLRYQWRLDGAALSNVVYFAGANSSFLHVGPLLYAHEGVYDVVISDDCGPANAVTSKVARLTIKPGPEWVFPFRSRHGI